MVSGPPTFRDRGWRGHRDAYRQALDPESLAEVLGVDEAVVLQQEMLRRATSDDPEDRVVWEALARGTTDLRSRERYVASLWEVLSQDSAFSEAIENRWAALDIYCRYLYLWFLGRYDFRRALALMSTLPSARWLPWIWAGGAVVWLTGAFAMGGVDLPAGFSALLGMVLLLLLVRSAAGLPPFALLQALVPRLGAGVAVGYLALGSSPHLLAAFGRWQAGGTGRWAVAAGLLALVWVYAAYHVRSHVPAPLAPLQALRRAGELVALGVGWAGLGLSLAGPFLTSAAFRGQPGASAAVIAPSPAPSELALLATLALGLGFILQLIWEEKPVTELP